MDFESKSKVSSASQYLDAAGTKYLNLINNTSSDSLIKVQEGFSALNNCTSNPSQLMSVGVGQGEEVEALHLMFPGTEIIGIDLANTAILSTRQRLKNNTNISYLVANATEIPLVASSVDVVVMAAILHEVYSYSSTNIRAVEDAIKEATRVLVPGGVLFLRECAPPLSVQSIKLEFLTEESRDFYQYYRSEFRCFSSWNDQLVSEFEKKRVRHDQEFPPIENNKIELHFSEIDEFLRHFRYYVRALDANAIKPADVYWKEINERYFFDDPSGSNKVLNVNSFGDFIKQASGERLECLQTSIKTNIRAVAFLREHIKLQVADNSEEELFDQTFQTMEFLFKKQ